MSIRWKAFIIMLLVVIIVADGSFFVNPWLFIAVGAALCAFLAAFAAKLHDDMRGRADRLQKEHERIRLILDATPMACRLWNKEYQIIELNDETVKLFRASNKQDFIDNYYAFSPVYQPDGRLSQERTAELLNKAFIEGFSVFEWTHQTKDGELIPVEITLVRLTYAGEEVLAGYTRDLREQKKYIAELNDASVKLKAALREAQNANRAKSDFLAKMSHEMRTPLNAVIGLSVLSLEDRRVGGDTRVNLEKIYASGSTLLSTVNDILDISKIEAGKLDLIPVVYDVPSLINDAVTQNAPRIGDKPIEFILDVSEDMYISLYGDELRVRQIINNLLSNAIKYTKEGEVELSLHCVDTEDEVELVIRVRDTGIGIREEDLLLLFSDYTQVDMKSNREIEGTGLGLTITKRLAEMMGGSISVLSEYGQGSTFTVKVLQLTASRERIGRDVVESLKRFKYTDQRYEDTRISHVSLPYAHVLIVDDNVTNLDVAEGLMAPYEMRIDCVTSGQQAVDAIREEKVHYNAIFMDQMMPGMDGVEAMVRIRGLGTAYAKNIPVIAFTANVASGNEQTLMNSGFQAFLSKPIDVARLDDVIRHWVRDEEQEKAWQDAVRAKEASGIDARVQPDRRSVPTRRSGLDRRLVNSQFAGLDIDKGIERYGGIEETYLKILRSYCVNTRPLLDQIENVDESRLDEYSTIVHGIKGSSHGIFAEMISDVAEKLELASKAGEYEFVSSHNEAFIFAVRKLISDVEGMLSTIDRDNPRPVKPKPEPELLMRLVDACKAYDMDNVDSLMEELDQFDYQEDEGLGDWLKENVMLMNFKEIIERLS